MRDDYKIMWTILYIHSIYIQNCVYLMPMPVYNTHIATAIYISYSLGDELLFKKKILKKEEE